MPKVGWQSDLHGNMNLNLRRHNNVLRLSHKLLRFHCTVMDALKDFVFLTGTGTLVRKRGPACFIRAGRVDCLGYREGRNGQQATAGQRQAQAHLSYL